MQKCTEMTSCHDHGWTGFMKFLFHFSLCIYLAERQAMLKFLDKGLCILTTWPPLIS